MAKLRIMTDNFLDPDVVSNATASSEQSAFPASNAYNFQRRSKVWRSNGYWEITDSNKTIIFQETAAINLTGTIATGNYTSSTTLFAAIKAAMEAVGDSTYTLSSDVSTNKTKFTSNGAGGGNIFTIKWTEASCAGLAGLLGFNTAEDDTGALTYTADQLKIHSSEWLKWDMGISTNPKGFFLIGARNTPIAITPSATLKLQGNETDVWTAPTFETTLSYNDSVISLLDSVGLHTEALRYWRLEILDTSNPQGYAEIGALFLGDFFEPTRGAAQFPFQGNYVDRSITAFSEGGQTFADIREQTEEFSISWFGLTVAEKEDIDLHFSAYGTSKPFFVQLDPDSAFSSNANYYTRYVKFASAPRYQLVSPGNFAMTMDLREEL